MKFKKSSITSLVSIALLGLSASASASLVQNGQLDLGAQGFGNAPRLLTIQGSASSTVESGAIGIVDGALVALTPGITDSSVFLGNGVQNMGGDTVSPLGDNMKYGIPTLGSLSWSSASDVRLLLNGTEPSGNGITVNDVTLKFYNGNTVIAAVDGSFELASTITGNGSSGFLINVDQNQQAYLNTNVFGLGGSSDFRIALESTITGAAGGTESYLAVMGSEVVSAVPEPETYAMLLSGLGLLGFVGRRKKQKSTDVASEPCAA